MAAAEMARPYRALVRAALATARLGLAAAGLERTAGFGLRSHPILPVTRLHAGADIGAAMGQPVEAAADGVVLLAEVRGGYGNTVVLDIEPGMWHLFQAIDSLSPKAHIAVQRIGHWVRKADF